MRKGQVDAGTVLAAICGLFIVGLGWVALRCLHMVIGTFARAVARRSISLRSALDANLYQPTH